MNKLKKEANYRKNERHSCHVPIDGKDGTVFDQTQAINFSKGGLGFISKHRIPVHREIPIEIELTCEGNPVFVVGQVQWVKRMSNAQGYRIGVSFKEVLRGSKSRLNEYFKKAQ